MKIVLRRRHDDGEATIGDLFIDGEWMCDTLEDQHQDVKVPGETRIPAGRYALELKPVGASRFDETATKIMHGQHHGMIRLRDVPEFSEVLIHWGNFETDTAGCILVGEREGTDLNGHHMVERSVAAYRKVYPLIAKAIRGEGATIEIIDGDRVHG